jgi:hypothetical protein
VLRRRMSNKKAAISLIREREDWRKNNRMLYVVRVYPETQRNPSHKEIVLVI